nr:MAG TPA: hypothetical protein [Caudoviricetes sp.]
MQPLSTEGLTELLLYFYISNSSLCSLTSSMARILTLVIVLCFFAQDLKDSFTFSLSNPLIVLCCSLL